MGTITPSPAHSKKEELLFLGLDTGYARLGYSILSLASTKTQPSLMHYGVIETSPHEPDGDRLLTIEASLTNTITGQKIRSCALEEVFIRKSISTGVRLLEARGVILLVLARHQIPVHSVSPTSMKRMVTGSGSASKQQIQRVVMKILGLQEMPQPDDAADAIALSLCAWLEYKSLITHKRNF